MRPHFHSSLSPDEANDTIEALSVLSEGPSILIQKQRLRLLFAERSSLSAIVHGVLIQIPHQCARYKDDSCSAAHGLDAVAVAGIQVDFNVAAIAGTVRIKDVRQRKGREFLLAQSRAERESNDHAVVRVGSCSAEQDSYLLDKQKLWQAVACARHNVTSSHLPTDRMIINIQPARADEWLKPTGKSTEELQALLSDRQTPYYEHRSRRRSARPPCFHDLRRARLSSPCCQSISSSAYETGAASATYLTGGISHLRWWELPDLVSRHAGARIGTVHIISPVDFPRCRIDRRTSAARCARACRANASS